MLIETKDKAGKPNGWVQPIWKPNDAPHTVRQVYAIAVLPGTSKGPHLHHKRTGYLACVTGRVECVLRAQGEYIVVDLLPDDPARIIPRGIPLEIRNPGPDIAVLVNCPDAPYDPQDNEEVRDWNPPDGLTEER